jgi:hypothetical protein
MISGGLDLSDARKNSLTLIHQLKVQTSLIRSYMKQWSSYAHGIGYLDGGEQTELL